MSDILYHMVEPYREGVGSDFEEIKGLFEATAYGWNLAIMKTDPQFNLNEHLADIDMPEGMLEFFSEIEQRKAKLYPNNKRLMLSVDFADLGDDFHIFVSSTPPR